MPRDRAASSREAVPISGLGVALGSLTATAPNGPPELMADFESADESSHEFGSPPFARNDMHQNSGSSDDDSELPQLGDVGKSTHAHPGNATEENHPDFTESTGEHDAVEEEFEDDFEEDSDESVDLPILGDSGSASQLGSTTASCLGAPSSEGSDRGNLTNASISPAELLPTVGAPKQRAPTAADVAYDDAEIISDVEELSCASEEDASGDAW
eukprot:scaffold178725_cov25-Tisochrysis_lutea.AAC.2